MITPAIESSPLSAKLIPVMPRFPLFLALAFAALLSVPASAAKAPLSLDTFDTPAAARACAPTFATSPEGHVYLSWLEPAADHAWALRVAQLNLPDRTWSAPHTVATSPHLAPNRSDPPQLAAGTGGRLAVLWHQAPVGGHAHGGGAAFFSTSKDSGLTWSPPQPLSRESHEVEFASLAALPGGRFLAAWLDGRGKQHGGSAQQLYARVLGDDSPDHLVDDSVCDCCHTALLAFPDGSALLAYRDRAPGEIRDIYVARFSAGEWDDPRVLNDDNWHIAGCPVNGPRLSAVGGHVAAAWFTAADNDPRVLVSTSPDAGARFTMPQRIDLGHAAGRVDVASLRDGTRVVAWVENADAASNHPAMLHLRRLSPRDELGEPLTLPLAGSARDAGFPRLAVVKDYDATPAQLLLVFSAPESAARGLEARLITLPALSELAGRSPCASCDEAEAAAARGFALRGEVKSVAPERQAVIVQHEAIPGVMRAMTMQFRVDAGTLAQLAPGQSILGRIERRGREWWLFAVRVLARGAGDAAPSPR